MNEPAAGSKEVVSFGPFSLDPSRRLLLKDGAPIVVGARTLDTLIALVARPNEAISKRELMAVIWPDVTVEEGSLRVQIAALRKTLGDGKGGARYITTLAGRGYCFVAPISRVGDRGSERAAAAASFPAPPEPAKAGSTQPALAALDKPSIAVLPFANLSGDPEQEYFADGMVEEITTAIARLPWLFVIARNSAFTYKGKAVDVKQVAQELGVRYVLEGSVRKAGNRVRITGQLIDTATSAHIWADRFDGALDDIFELQDQVASSVAGAIEPKLRQSEIERASRKPTANLTAYDLYLRALASSYRYTEAGFAEAVVLAQQALAIDPSYAPAAALVGWCRGLQRVQGWRALSADDVAEAYRLARQALEAERDDAETISVLPGRCSASLARRRWRRRLSIAPWRLTRTRLSPGWPEGISTRRATSRRWRSKLLNGRAV